MVGCTRDGNAVLEQTGERAGKFTTIRVENCRVIQAGRAARRALAIGALAIAARYRNLLTDFRS